MNKRLLSIACALLLPCALSAQDAARGRALSLSLGAETRGITLSYEQRLLSFSAEDHLSLRGFLGYGFSSSKQTGSGFVHWRLSTYLPSDDEGNRDRALYDFGDLQEYSLGVEANYLHGKGKHFLELGGGIALDYFSVGVNFHSSRKTLGETPTPAELLTSPGSKLANHYYGRIGYRFVSRGGITLGAGLSVHRLEGLFTHFYAAGRKTTPYLSIGYSF